MPLSDFIVRDAILPELRATTKDAVLRELVEGLRQAGAVGPQAVEDVLKALLQRESLASTGIGNGVAIPHAKHANVSRLYGTVGLCPPGVAFGSCDGQPVHVFVLLTAPLGEPGPHLRALELVSRKVRDDNFIQALRRAGTREAIWALLQQ